MKAFLSHSSKDKPFVSQVASALGKTQCEFDEWTFEYPAALGSINRAVDRTPALLAPYFIRADIHLALNDTPAAERDLKKINELLSDAGGFSEGDEARVQELDIRILIEKGQLKLAKNKVQTSAFLPRVVERRLLQQVARAVGFSPNSVDQSLRDWAKSYVSKSGGRKP